MLVVNSKDKYAEQLSSCFTFAEDDNTQLMDSKILTPTSIYAKQQKLKLLESKSTTPRIVEKTDFKQGV